MKYAGVYFQPMSSIQKWKDRGINVMFGCESEGGRVSKDRYKAECKRLGMKYYDVVGMAENVEALAQDPDLLGFMMDDEPDRRIFNLKYDQWKKIQGTTDGDKLWAEIQNLLVDYRALADRIRKTGKPVFQNFAGSTVGSAYGWYKGECHKWLLPSIDEISMDYYPKTMNPDRYPNIHVGLMLDLLAQWNKELGQPVKPMWACLECSDQKLNTIGHAPTVQDMDEQFAECEKRGLKGVIWFPQQIGSFMFDALKEPQLGKLVALSKKITAPADRVAQLEKKVEALQNAIGQIGAIVAKIAT